MGAGAGRRASLPARGVLTVAQKELLAGMADEEKLAHDVYTALARAGGDARFTRIATAEARHLEAVRTLLTRYGVADPTADKSDGAFAGAATTARYAALVRQGSASPEAALAVGRAVERADLADLATAGRGVTAVDVTTVYRHLAAASSSHLRAFGG
jgi:hypothetical protein